MKKQGMSLIELMIVITIISILTAIAVPSYRDFKLENNRSDAHQALLAGHAQMEKKYAETGSYPTTFANTGISASSSEGLYDIDFSGTPTATSYILEATPASSTIQTNDTACLSITINHLGTKGGTSGASCW